MSPKFNLDDRLDAVEARNLGASIPTPLHERIDELCELVYGARYAKPPLKKMVAALVLAAPTDPQQLHEILTAYDGALVRDALISGRPKGAIVEFPRRKSGPRPRSPR